MQQNKISKSTIAFTAVCIAFSLFGCGPTDDKKADTGSTATKETKDTKSDTPSLPASGLSIGLVASQNGELKPWGDDCIKGAKLALDDFNKAGGLDGKSVELKIGDSNSKPEGGKSAAEKLMSDGAIGLVGEVSSGITAQMGQSASEKGVPVVAVGATRTDLTAGKNNIFRVCYTDAFQGPVMAVFAAKELGLKKVALMTDKKQPYSTGLSASFAETFKKLGGEIVDEQFYESGQTQFSGQLTNLKAKNPDGLFMSGYFNETGPIAKQAKEAGLNVKFMGGDGWDSAQILESGGDAIDGGFFCNHYNGKEDRKEVKDFLSKWKSTYGGEPGTTMGALGYDATMLTLVSLKAAKTKDSKGLLDAIAETVDFPGVSGKITLKGMSGNPLKRAIVVRLSQKDKGQVFAKAYEPDEIQKDLAGAK